VITLEQMRAAWEAVARYRVIISERDRRGQRRRVLDEHLELAAARRLADQENARIQAAPDYRGAWTAPLAMIELENPDEARVASRLNTTTTGD
jgi:hypothetical protein